MSTATRDDVLRPATVERVCRRLGLGTEPRHDRAGLDAVYGAWCRHVPFDNVRKLLALAGDAEDEPLPGATAEDFFAHWLADGAGGTCWPSSNGLYTVLRALGFAARRISASMHDTGVPNHGSVVVSLAEGDYLADSSLLTGSSLPLRRGRDHDHDVEGQRVRVSAASDTWVLEFPLAAGGSMRCRLLEDPVTFGFYRDRYELSRRDSPFNHALYARRGAGRERVAFQGVARFAGGDGAEPAELSREELLAALPRDLGLSEEICGRLADLPVFGRRATPAAPVPDRV
ncbi:MAG: arylamine N-acetyltransferase [Thermoanaerobaculia bacterium]|nr:arylamine N-acetyltransferase [Thermoanaerobaculia bacterium]